VHKRRLLELLLKRCELLFQIGDFISQVGDFPLEVYQPFGVRCHDACLAFGSQRFGRCVCLRGCRLICHVSGKEMRVTSFFRSWLSRQQFHQRWLAVHQETQRGMDGIEIVEGVHALGARAEFAGGLRAAEEQHADQGGLVPMKVEDVGEAVLVFRNAAVGGGGAGQTLLGQSVESAADGVFIEVHHGVAVRFLIGGVLERVERQRVIVGCSDLFFDETAEDASLDGRQGEVHSNMIHDELRPPDPGPSILTERRSAARTPAHRTVVR
jgi:hypothetical protein